MIFKVLVFERIFGEVQNPSLRAAFSATKRLLMRLEIKLTRPWLC